MRSAGKSPRPHAWAYLTRTGSEQTLVDELGVKVEAQILADGLVLAADRAREPGGTQREPVFARQAMRTSGHLVPADPASVAAALGALLNTPVRNRSAPPWTLQVVAPDSGRPRDPRRKAAELLDAALTEPLDALLSRPIADAFVSAEDAERLAQVWFVTEERVLVGVTPVGDVLTRIPGGRAHRERLEGQTRATLKLEEAIEWIGQGPERGETCVELGEHGAWARLGAVRGAQCVWVGGRGTSEAGLRVLEENPFAYSPEETVDWLLVDLTRRPLEVLRLAGKWGRRVWARQLYLSFKLPMKQKSAFVAQALEMLQEAGWRGLRARQLFHDGEEITVYAWLDPKLVVRGKREPFRLRSAERKDGRTAPKRRAPAKR